jgi:hypothetical protein
MRNFALLLSAGAALSSISASAAVNDVASQHAIVVAANCPKMEGYPDCHPDGEDAWNTRSARAFRTRS